MIDTKNPDFTSTPGSRNRPKFGYNPMDCYSSPYVTIITPFYNPGPIFNDTASSVLNQSFQQWEWLIINDGSDDPKSLSILNDFRSKDPRIKVIDHELNKGLSAARNTGFRSARCKYIVQLDSDDLLEATAVEKWFWFLESYPEYAFCKGYSVGFGAQEYLWDKGFHLGKTFLYVNLVAPTSMIRKHIHTIVNGYDESIQQGLEDWDFWLRCASKGYWGGNIPEYLDWYRRRAKHNDRWSNWDNGKNQRAFRMNLRKKYNELWNSKFPEIQLRSHLPYDDVPDELPCQNLLKKDKPRLLMIVPWLSMGGADKFNLDLVRQLTNRGWQITIASTLPGSNLWLPQFTKYTPDIFVLPNFLRLLDHPRFLRYLIQSRQIDAAIVSHSELGYLLLPYFRSHFSEVAFIDLCHIEEEYWKNGGYPRMSVDYQDSLDLDIVGSEHLKTWMANRGAEQDRVCVCHTNIDTDDWHPDPEARVAARKELGIEERTTMILYAGRICPQKQPFVFAKTIQKLAQTEEDFVSIVAGDGQDLNRLKGFININKLNKWAKFLGEVPNERIKLLMASSDIFFLPSKWEGIALTIYEAMAMELPVVGADVGGQRELVTPECGILIRRSNEETEASQYSEILLDLLKNPQHRKKMGKAGRERVRKHFTLDQMVERMVCLIEKAKALNKNNPRPAYTPAQGHTFASQAIELLRLSQQSDHLWAQLYNPNWRIKLFHILRNLGEPFFQWAVDRGWTWQFTVSDMVKRFLLRNS